MNFIQLQEIIAEEFGAKSILKTDETSIPAKITIPAEKNAEICDYLFRHQQTYFDFLSCLTGIDNGKNENTMEVLYHLSSIPYNMQICLSVELPRENPTLKTVSHIWKSANWHEREAFDLLGIHFEGHPDLRRILMPADWEGYPLRKDYQIQTHYHGIEVKY